jgi:NRAMP (natural resistance-associated macrophage protein)-like metal ion transporter
MAAWLQGMVERHPTMSRPSLIKRFLRALGPGLLTGAADDDPSGIVTYSIAGAGHGFELLWLSWATWPLMAAVQLTCARIGMVTGEGLGAALKKKFPKPIVIVLCVALFIANAINIGADLSGMADAAAMLTPLPAFAFIPLFGAAIALAMVKCHYDQIANILKWLVLSLLAYAVTAFRPDWAKVAHETLLPRAPVGEDIWQTIVAILGTTISPYLFFWQSAQEVEEDKAKGKLTVAQRMGATRWQITNRMLDVGAGTLASNFVMFFIILAAALTLHVQGKTDITTSREAAEALRPFAGDFAAAIYAIGIVAVGVLAIPTLADSAAFAFSETMNWKHGLSRKLHLAARFYTVIFLSIGLGAAINFLGINPIQALFWSGIINGVLAPFLLAGIVMIAHDPKLMRCQANPLWTQIIVTITAIAMFAAAIIMGIGMMSGATA